MTNIENYKSLARRTGYNSVPVDFNMCSSLEQRFNSYVKQNDIQINFSHSSINDIEPKPFDVKIFDQFYPGQSFKPGTEIDMYGVAHEPGSAAAFHMTKMYHPMNSFDSVEQILAYPLPDYSNPDITEMCKQVRKAHDHDLIAMSSGMQCTVWETAWYMRGMENLMMDMMSEDEMATVLLDRVTDNAIIRAECFAKSDIDVLFLGDDIGMQKTILMSEELYTTWLKPRLKRVIDAARAIKPDILVFYHSCGLVTPLIPHLIEAGIDVLDPVQPECMDFGEIHKEFGDRLSFHGSIGTQTTMPFGTPDEVRREVFKNMDIAGSHGGLLVAPTHLLEPEVPAENILAYVTACNDYLR